MRIFVASSMTYKANDMVLLCCHVHGGVGARAVLVYNNTMISCNMLEASRRNGGKR
jgi:hypothetical protein